MLITHVLDKLSLKILICGSENKSLILRILKSLSTIDFFL